MGSGAAIPTLSRHCSAQSVNINGFRMLLDCGEGTQNQLRAYHQKLQSFNLVCISHLHGDHLFGLPGLLSTMHLCGRTEPIDVVGPKGIKAILEPIFLFSNTVLNYELRITELEGDEYRQVFEERRCKVFAFPLHHSVPTYGYVIEEIPRSANSTPRRYAYCCDTAYDESILPSSKTSTFCVWKAHLQTISKPWQTRSCIAPPHKPPPWHRKPTPNSCYSPISVPVIKNLTPSWQKPTPSFQKPSPPTTANAMESKRLLI